MVFISLLRLPIFPAKISFIKNTVCLFSLWVVFLVVLNSLCISFNAWFILELDLIGFFPHSLSFRGLGVVFQTWWMWSCGDSGFSCFSPMTIVSLFYQVIFLSGLDGSMQTDLGCCSDLLSGLLLWVCSKHVWFRGQRCGEAEFRVSLCGHGGGLPPGNSITATDTCRYRSLWIAQWRQQLQNSPGNHIPIG